MKFPLYIAKRYLFTKSSNNAINVITIIAAFGIIIGAASLLVVLSGFAGLKDFSLQFTTFSDPDLKISPVQGKNFLISNDQLQYLDSIDGIASYSKIIEERAVLTFKSKNQIISLKGVDENYPEVTIDSILEFGSWFMHGTDQIVIGGGVSYNLSIGVFDYGEAVQISVPKPGKGQISSPRAAFNSINAVNSGVFSVNESLDNTAVFANLETVQHLLNYKNNQISAIEIQLEDDDNIEQVKQELIRSFGDNFTVKSRAQLNDALYKMLNTEYLAVYLIFTLVLIIALFNVVGSIIMMILDKKKNLKMLFNIGATMKDIRKIFFLQGSLMTLLGGSIGILLGLFVILLQQQFSLVMITSTLAYPVIVKFWNIVIVFLTISVLGVLASKLASIRISKGLISN